MLSDHDAVNINIEDKVGLHRNCGELESTKSACP